MGNVGAFKSDECHLLVCPQRDLKKRVFFALLAIISFSQIKITVIILLELRLMLF